MATKRTPKAEQPVNTAAPALVEVRVLVACAHGLPNDVAAISAEMVADGVRANQIDPHPDAVAYAKTLTK